MVVRVCVRVCAGPVEYTAIQFKLEKLPHSEVASSSSWEILTKILRAPIVCSYRR